MYVLIRLDWYRFNNLGQKCHFYLGSSVIKSGLDNLKNLFSGFAAIYMYFLHNKSLFVLLNEHCKYAM